MDESQKFSEPMGGKQSFALRGQALSLCCLPAAPDHQPAALPSQDDQLAGQLIRVAWAEHAVSVSNRKPSRIFQETGLQKCGGGVNHPLILPFQGSVARVPFDYDRTMESERANSVVRGVYLLYAGLAASIWALGTLTSRETTPFTPCLFGGLAILVGWLQFALSNAQHEGTHRNFGSPHREGLWELLTVLPLGFTSDYRRVHLDHHAHLGVPGLDPDHSAYAHLPRGWAGWLFFILLTLTGLPALSQFLAKGAPGSGGAQLPKLIAVQACLALAIFSVAPWWGYLAFWLLPLVTVAKLFSSLRLLAEHASPDGRTVIRSFSGPSAWFLGLFGFARHAEHHWKMQIPAADLEKLRGELPSEIQDVSVERFEGGHLARLASL